MCIRDRYNTAKAAYEEAAKKLADYEKAYEDAVNSADANADAADVYKRQEESRSQFLEGDVPIRVFCQISIPGSCFFHRCLKNRLSLYTIMLSGPCLLYTSSCV